MKHCHKTLYRRPCLQFLYVYIMDLFGIQNILCMCGNAYLLFVAVCVWESKVVLLHQVKMFTHLKEQVLALGTFLQRKREIQNTRIKFVHYCSFWWENKRNLQNDVSKYDCKNMSTLVKRKTNFVRSRETCIKFPFNPLSMHLCFFCFITSVPLLSLSVSPSVSGQHIPSWARWGP